MLVHRQASGWLICVFGLWLVCLAVLAPSPALAERLLGADKRPLLIMGTSDAPPYMIQATDSGLDVDIPRAALARLGYRLQVRYMSLARAEEELRSGRIDLMAPLFVGDKPGIYSSEPHVMYRPTAFSLAQRAVKVTTLSDLGDYQVMTFQGATDYFGPAFVEASLRSPAYSEVYNMNNLARSLFAGRTDLVVLDYNIFYYQLRQLDKMPVDILRVHEILPRVPAVVGFNRVALRDAFNGALRALRDDGSHAAILKRYSPQL